MEFQPMEERFVHRLISFLPPAEDRESESLQEKAEKEKDIFLSASSRETVTEVGVLTFCEVLHTRVKESCI